MKCPKGADCPDPDTFESVVPGTGWEIVDTPYGRRNRVIECPAGYIIVRHEGIPGVTTPYYEGDECVKCEKTMYSTDIAKYHPNEGEPLLAEEFPGAAKQRCIPCPDGGICDGGAEVRNSDDFWRNNFPHRSSKWNGFKPSRRSADEEKAGKGYLWSDNEKGWDLERQIVESGRQRLRDARREGKILLAKAPI